ncbi:MAG TPA: aminoglycoside phosphotransferase family protein [Patescibacteria group bacterium]|nr:aminoglycoside phosphotransferase family protein [Patescibacteria group bacterium]
MNKILQLFSEDYVIKLFKEQLLALYPQYQDIVGVEIRPYKEMIWTSTYHVVIGFKVSFIKPDKEKEKVLIVCSAHSNEERENVYQAMDFLWKNKFNRGHIDIPRPLFYSSYFQGTFYEGITGENLMYYIKNKDYPEIESMISLSAELFARLHDLPNVKEANFNPKNSRIKTVVPGVENILKEMEYRFDGKFSESFKKIYKYLIEKEENFLNVEGFKFSLIHGDAHTENVIHTGKGRVGLIDFTDLCLGDPARDIGTFMQQLEYKIGAKYGNPDYAKQMSDLFLSSYLEFSKQEDSVNLRERITLYYNWTAIRTAVYLFLKHDSNPLGAEELLKKVMTDLNLQ